MIGCPIRLRAKFKELGISFLLLQYEYSYLNKSSNQSTSTPLTAILTTLTSNLVRSHFTRLDTYSRETLLFANPFNHDFPTPRSPRRGGPLCVRRC